jgi:hypothetical protein
MSTKIHIKGWGAVSPAGWSARELADAVIARHDLLAKEECRPGGAPLCRTRPVPALSTAPGWLRHARLRRSSPATRFAVSATLEALHGSSLEAPPAIIFVTMNGSVNFSRRFFSEVQENPLLASPILFPETVFNAPSSHISSLLHSPAPNYTLIGDSAQFPGGMDLAAQWLCEGRVRDCLVIAAEELDWLTSEALHQMPGRRVASEGAAAVWLSAESANDKATAIVLDHITDAVMIRAHVSRDKAVRQMRAMLPSHPGMALCDSRCGNLIWDRAENQAAAGWSGRVFSPLSVLGDGFGVSAGWQVTLAAEVLARNIAPSIAISAAGGSQQATGAVLAADHLG